MSKSWELSDEQKKEIQEKQREIGAEYDPETGKKRNSVEGTEDTGDNEDVENAENIDRGRNGELDDDNIR